MSDAITGLPDAARQLHAQRGSTWSSKTPHDGERDDVARRGLPTAVRS